MAFPEVENITALIARLKKCEKSVDNHGSIPTAIMEITNPIEKKID